MVCLWYKSYVYKWFAAGFDALARGTAKKLNISSIFKASQTYKMGSRKKSSFFSGMARPPRGGGGKGLAKKKEHF